MNFKKFTTSSSGKKSPSEKKFSKEERARIERAKAVLEEMADSGFAITYGTVNKYVQIKGVFNQTVAKFLAGQGLSLKAQAVIVNRKGEISPGAPKGVKAIFAKKFGKQVPTHKLVTDPKVFSSK